MWSCVSFSTLQPKLFSIRIYSVDYFLLHSPSPTRCTRAGERLSLCTQSFYSITKHSTCGSVCSCPLPLTHGLNKRTTTSTDGWPTIKSDGRMECPQHTAGIWASERARSRTGQGHHIRRKSLPLRGNVNLILMQEHVLSRYSLHLPGSLVTSDPRACPVDCTCKLLRLSFLRALIFGLLGTIVRHLNV